MYPRYITMKQRTKKKKKKKKFLPSDVALVLQQEQEQEQEQEHTNQQQYDQQKQLEQQQTLQEEKEEEEVSSYSKFLSYFQQSLSTLITNLKPEDHSELIRATKEVLPPSPRQIQLLKEENRRKKKLMKMKRNNNNNNSKVYSSGSLLSLSSSSSSPIMVLPPASSLSGPVMSINSCHSLVEYHEQHQKQQERELKRRQKQQQEQEGDDHDEDEEQEGQEGVEEASQYPQQGRTLYLLQPKTFTIVNNNNNGCKSSDGFPMSQNSECRNHNVHDRGNCTFNNNGDYNNIDANNKKEHCSNNTQFRRLSRSFTTYLPQKTQCTNLYIPVPVSVPIPTPTPISAPYSSSPKSTSTAVASTSTSSSTSTGIEATDCRNQLYTPLHLPLQAQNNSTMSTSNGLLKQRQQQAYHSSSSSTPLGNIYDSNSISESIAYNPLVFHRTKDILLDQKKGDGAISGHQICYNQYPSYQRIDTLSEDNIDHLNKKSIQNHHDHIQSCQNRQHLIDKIQQKEQKSTHDIEEGKEQNIEFTSTISPNPNTILHTRTRTVSIYVHQREVAHVSSLQYTNYDDILLSTDCMTTCHALILCSRSYVSSNNGEGCDTGTPIITGSIAHLDTTGYQQCIETMVHTQIEFHKANMRKEKNMSTNRGDCSNSCRNAGVDIQMDVHLVGGYNDPKGSSSDLTNDIINVLDQISSSFKNKHNFGGNENTKDPYYRDDHGNDHVSVDCGTAYDDQMITKKRRIEIGHTYSKNFNDKDVQNRSTLPSQQLKEGRQSLQEGQSQNCEPVIRMILQTCIITKLNDVLSYEYRRDHNDNGDDNMNNCESRHAPKSTIQTVKEEKTSATSNSRTTSSWDFQHAPDNLYDDDDETDHVEPAMCNSSSPSNNKPIIRGIAFYLRSNKLVLLNRNITPSLHGPERILRAVRLWSSSPNGNDNKNYDETISSTSSQDSSNHKLCAVHTFDKDCITIKRFEIEPFDGMAEFMNLPDDLILQYGSTSPECEDDSFCDMMRKKCQFVLSLCDGDKATCTTVMGRSSSISPTKQVFGNRNCIEYELGDLGQWKKNTT